MDSGKPKIPDNVIKNVLRLIGDGKTYDDVVSEVVVTRTTISKSKKWFNSISWQEAKLYAEGEKSILKVRVDYLKKLGLESLFKDIQPSNHFGDLAEMARTLHYVQQILKISPTPAIFRDFLPEYVTKYWPPAFTPIFLIFPEYFGAHFNQEFTGMEINSWIDPLPENVLEKLRYLGNTARFDLCKSCAVCLDIGI